MSDNIHARGKERRRAALRAFNGAMLGMMTGGALGATLGAAFSVLVIHQWPVVAVGAVFGVPPGMFAGLLIGTTMVVRHPGKGIAAGVATGTAIGLLYACLLSGMGGAVYGCIAASGVIGGLVLSLLLRWIRARWGWWTRWENRQAAAPSGGGRQLRR